MAKPAKAAAAAKEPEAKAYGSAEEVNAAFDAKVAAAQSAHNDNIAALEADRAKALGEV